MITPVYIFLHHTADKSPDPQFDKINRYHKSRGFPKSSLGFYVGYQYLIGKSGHVKQARKEDEVGSHTHDCNCAADKTGLKGSGTANSKGVGICLAGDFTKETPTEASLSALVDLCEAIQGRWNIPDSRIFNHSEAKQTTCPGFAAAQYVRGALKVRRSIRKAREQLQRKEAALLNAKGAAKKKIEAEIARLKKRLS